METIAKGFKNVLKREFCKLPKITLMLNILLNISSGVPFGVLWDPFGQTLAVFGSFSVPLGIFGLPLASSAVL